MRRLSYAGSDDASSILALGFHFHFLFLGNISSSESQFIFHHLFAVAVVADCSLAGIHY
jgi:hypothetical protein